MISWNGPTDDIGTSSRIFFVEDWGRVGYASLLNFVPNKGEKPIAELKVNESTSGANLWCQKLTHIRVTRLF